jgi:hypothetical protein
MGAKKSLREQWADIPLERKIAMFIAPVVVFVMTGVLIPRVIGDNKAPDGTSFGKGAQVEVVDVVPVNSPGDDTRIEISARNIGQTVSVLTRVDFRIEAEPAYVSGCGAGAALGMSQTYDLELPQFADRGQIIPVRISQEIRPDEADRFAFNVGVVTLSGAEPGPVIYQLGVLLFHDGQEAPIDAGRIVIAEPFPDDSAYYSEEFWVDRGFPPEEAHECVASNIASVKGVLSLSGVKSPALTRLAESL